MVQEADDPLYVPSGAAPETGHPEFTVAEQELFERRYQNGYDFKHDERYNLWLECYHPENSGTLSGLV